MFERYTEKARRTIFFARYEASQFGSPYIETEHLLLGLLREDKRLTNRFLRSHASVESIRRQIEARTLVREKVSTSVDLPLSNECKRVLAYAAEEAERLGHAHIGTEHLLLGLLREGGCFAAQLLTERGVELRQMREAVAAAPPDPVPDEQEKKPQRLEDRYAALRQILERAGAKGQSAEKAFPEENIFERCTEEARQAISRTLFEASRFGSPCIETEHLLLGALHEGKAHLDLFLPNVESRGSLRAEIEEHTLFREKVSTFRNMPFTQECKRALHFAAEEADALHQELIGPEHLLLGLLRGEHSFAARVLRERGADIGRIRGALASPPHQPPREPEEPSRPE
jgi:ATP-dependent Clp protease ATP-binding subunit ClpA